MKSVLRLIIVVAIICASSHIRIGNCFADELAELVRSHSDSIDRLVSGSVVISLESREPGARLPYSLTTCNWIFDRAIGEERLTIDFNSSAPKASGKMERYDLLMRRDGTYSWLQNFDFDKPIELDPTGSSNDGVRGDVGVVEGILPGGYDPRGSLLLLVETMPSRSLKQAIAAGAKLLKSESVGGNLCHVVEIEPDDASELRWTSRVFIDPSVGFMIRKVEQVSQTFQSGGKTVSVRIDALASEFQKFDGGVFLPSKVVVKRSDSKFDTEVNATYESINSKIQSDRFEFIFPKFCWVREFVSMETFIADGKGGKITSWSTPEDMLQRLREHFPDGPGKKVGTPISRKLLALLAFLLVVVIGFVIYRKRLA